MADSRLLPWDDVRVSSSTDPATVANLSRGGTTQSFVTKLIELADAEQGLSEKTKERLAKLSTPVG